MPTFISLFSGIGAADLGFERAGFRCVAQVESHPWRQKLLAARWPDVPRFDDVCTVGADNLPRADVIVGGFPCQDLSVAGKRRGLAGERSGLFYEFSRIIDELAPPWFCIENVPGLLSSDPTPKQRGGDFGLVLLELTGYPPDIPKDGWRTSGICSGPKRTVAWRVLDSRYFGVAQRRRRVFIVGGPGASSGFKVLFEPEGGNGDFEAGDTEGEEVAYALTGGAGSCRFDLPGDTYICQGGNTKQHGKGWSDEICYTLDGANTHAICHSVRPSSGRWLADGADNFIAGTVTRKWAKGSGGPAGDECQNLVTGPLLGSGAGSSRPSGLPQESEMLVCAPSDPDGVREATGVSRRVDLPVREESRAVCTCPDTPRYASLGDAMTVNVMYWIARRIRSVMV